MGVSNTRIGDVKARDVGAVRDWMRREGVRNELPEGRDSV